MLAFLTSDPKNWIIFGSLVLVIGIFALVVKLVNWMVKVHGGEEPETNSESGIYFEG